MRSLAVLRVPAVALVMATVAPVSGHAQGAPPLRLNEPSWLWRWSPIVPLSELRRTLPGEGLALPRPLTRPAPRVGLFWTAGIPGAAPSEVQDDRAEFRYVHADLSGDYRRPLDPGEARHNAGAALAWGNLGGSGGGIGRVVVDRGNFDREAFADILHPYATEPFAVADTVGDAVGRTAVRIEGAGGWQVGRFGLGLAAGYHQQETRTLRSAAPRSNRTANPGVSVGATFDVHESALQVGVMARWQQEADQIAVYSVAAPSRVYEFAGYADPVPLNLVSTRYGRRFERTARAVGAGLGGTLHGGRWVVHGRLEDRTGVHFSSNMANPNQEEWASTGWLVGGAAQYPLVTDRLVLTLDGWVAGVAGEAQYSGLEGVPFAADEAAWTASGELRLLPTNGWQAVGFFSVTREQRTRRDGIARTHSDLSAWRPSGGLTVARHLGAFGVSLGGAVGEFNPSGAAPLAHDMGPIYQNWIAPELALYATEARWVAGSGGISWRVRPSVLFAVDAQYRRLTGTENLNSAIGTPPTGDRQRWSLDVGILVGQI